MPLSTRNFTEANSASVSSGIGATGDAAVTGDTAGSQNAKLRGLSKMIFDMWDSTNHWLQVKVMNAVTLGQQLTTASTSVVPASDSPNFPMLQKNPAWTSIYTTTQTGVASWGGSSDLNVANYSQIMITINLSAIAGSGTPTATFKWTRKDSFANYISLYASAALSATGVVMTSIGPGLSINHVLGTTGQLVVNLSTGGNAVSSTTFTVDIQGR